MEKNTENIKLILSKINYPGYNRDIVSFGIVKDIRLVDNNVYLSLSVKTNDENNKKIIENEIKKYLLKEFNFSDIKISFVIESISQNNNNPNIKKIIAVSSCKGGVGKSTIALNLALEISKNFKVGLLDLDIYGPSLSTLINFNEQPKFDGNKIYPINKYGIELMSFGFINNENSPTIWRGPMVSRMTQQFFEQVEWGELDFLFLDLPPGTGDIQLTLVQKVALSGAVIITTPQDLALLDVKKASDMFNQLKTPILGVVENMSNFLISGIVRDLNGNAINGTIETETHNYKIENGKTTLNFEIFKGFGGLDESQRLDVPLLSKIPIDSDLALCTDNGTPYVFEHKTYITECYENIGKKIEQIIL